MEETARAQQALETLPPAAKPAAEGCPSNGSALDAVVPTNHLPHCPAPAQTAGCCPSAAVRSCRDPRPAAGIAGIAFTRRPTDGCPAAAPNTAPGSGPKPDVILVGTAGACASDTHEAAPVTEPAVISATLPPSEAAETALTGKQPPSPTDSPLVGPGVPLPPSPRLTPTAAVPQQQTLRDVVLAVCC